MSQKELWQTMMIWIAIDRKDQEQLASVRAELAQLASREEPKPDMLSIKLY